MPLFCGIFASILRTNPTDIEIPLVSFQQQSVSYLIALSLIVVSFSGSCTFILNQMVIDKETKMRETLRIMSMSRGAYTMSYFLTQSCFSFCSGVILSICFALHGSTENNIKLLLSVTCLGFALVAMSMALSTCFTDSKLSAQLGMTLIVLPTSIYFYFLTNQLHPAH
jgi:hypothetical protein